MKLTVIYIIMILVIFLILFLTIRFILQMVLLKDCPNCGKTVSIVKGRECPGCGYVFLRNRQWKLNTAIALLAIALIGFSALNIYSFRKQTKQYYDANPYLWKGELVASTEIDAPVEEISGSITEEAPSLPDAAASDPNAVTTPATDPSAVTTPAADPSAANTPAADPNAVNTPTDAPAAGETAPEGTNPVAGVLGELFQ